LPLCDFIGCTEGKFHNMPAPRRFPPPWSIDEQTESIIVKDAHGQPLAYVYFENEPQRQMSVKRLSRDEARRRGRVGIGWRQWSGSRPTPLCATTHFSGGTRN